MSTENNKPTFLFEKVNYKILFIGVGLIALGFISFILEGLAFVYVFQLFRRGEKPLLEGLIFGLVVYGIIMGGVGVLAEGAKHYVTSLSTWLLVEGAFYLVTGAVVGSLVGLIYGKSSSHK